MKTALVRAGILTAGAAAAAAAIFLPMQSPDWPVAATLGEAGPTYAQVNVEPEVAVADEEYAIYLGMNKALQEGDRDAFIAWGTGDGQIQLGRWWDLGRSIGWSTAAVTGNLPVDGETVPIYMGSQLGFPTQSLREEEKGLDLLQGEYFNATFSGEGASARITNLESRHNLFAWSDFPEALHVEKRKHVTVVGWEEDRDYLIELADRSEVVALESFKVLSQFTDTFPTSGYLIQSSGDHDKLTRWLRNKGIPENWAGLAVPTQRPTNKSEALDPRYATGSYTSGSTIVMRPDLQDTNVDAVILHEMLHVLHRSAMPANLTLDHDDAASAEGYARNMQRSLDTPEMTKWMLSETKPFVAKRGYAAFDVSEIRGPNAHLAYQAAAYMYDYAESLGISKWELALQSTNSGVPFAKTVAEMSNGKANEADYKKFVAAL